MARTHGEVRLASSARKSRRGKRDRLYRALNPSLFTNDHEEYNLRQDKMNSVIIGIELQGKREVMSSWTDIKRSTLTFIEFQKLL